MCVRMSEYSWYDRVSIGGFLYRNLRSYYLLSYNFIIGLISDFYFDRVLNIFNTAGTLEFRSVTAFETINTRVSISIETSIREILHLETEIIRITFRNYRWLGIEITISLPS